MINRRTLLAGLLATALVPTTLFGEAFAHHTGKRRRRRRVRAARRRKTRRARKPFKLAKRFQPQRVFFRNRYKRGTIVVDPRNHYLYLVESRIHARRYGVGVGRAGLAFKGSARIGRKAKWPSWTPTAGMIRREPQKYLKYKDGVPGGPGNPLGARALYLYKGKRDTLFRIHGTTAPWSIGRSVSNGCIRMVNDHVIDLYNRVPRGARVVVI
ncbi:L,D-transpeptidase [Pseudahrensia aquimaris]|uniref:L,D-transpeptidase n=1 Tax=Pseudahrensia aquimaris TaxID=744461 RepID=A0ABW3FIH1_9HYPH